MLNVNNLSVYFGGDSLFDSISFRLGKGDRVGLIGKNGAGKSTLLKILAKNQNPTFGNITFDKNCKIGYLSQDFNFEYGRSVIEETYLAFEEILKIENRQKEINKIIEKTVDFESEEYKKILLEFTDLNSQYEILGGYNYQSQTEKILLGLGFTSDDLHSLTDTFSGGWRMRIELAKLLLNDNDILLLDEPTNHLDIESIIWLEQFLLKYKGAIIVVSHDKMFLDRITNRTIEIVKHRIFDFKKSYSNYMILRKELRQQQKATQKNQDKQIQQTEKLIEKFRAKASKASMAQSLIKKLNKIERVEIDPEENKEMKFEFHISQQPGKIIFKAQDISKYFGEKKVLSKVNFEIERGEKVAFVGQNGQGKSTLAKIIIGELECEGHLKLGHNVKLGYFAQDQSSNLEGSNSVIEEAENTSSPENRTKVRDLLGAFLFSGEDVDKKIHVLSGGERNRLALCKLLLQPFNVLIMDEPTNHLDILSKNILKEALKKFEGTLILVSHDRDFLQGLCEKVIAFKDNKVKPFLGDLNSYLEDQKLLSIKDLEKKSKNTNSHNGNETKKSFIEHKKNREINKKVKKIENKIAQLEKEIKDIDFDLEVDYERTIREPNFFDIYQAKKNKLKNLIDEWEAIQTK